MVSGVYIVANDRVIDNAIALMSSIRNHDPGLPVIMIPFDHQYQETARILKETYQVELFPDLSFLDDFTATIGNIFPRDFLKLPNKMRKLAAWFGPLDEFLYIDTDIIVFRPLSETLSFLKTADFLNCDFHYKGRQLADVFSDVVIQNNIFSPEALTDVFNSGFWGSRKGCFSMPTMTALLEECAAHREYFDFSSGTTDQPIMNYLVLKGIERRCNVVKVVPDEPGSWAGSPHFTEQDHILYDGDRPLRYLHWAGTPMREGGPYRHLWEHYRYRDLQTPLKEDITSSSPGLINKLKSYFS
jgi:hypothetical protein